MHYSVEGLLVLLRQIMCTGDLFLSAQLHMIPGKFLEVYHAIQWAW